MKRTTRYGTVRLHVISGALFALLLLAASSCVRPPERAERYKAARMTSPDPQWVDRTLRSMTLEEKAAQLVFPWTTSYYMAEGSERWQELERLVKERKIGGLIVSLGDVYEYAVQLNKLQEEAKVPLLVAADFEYGAGMRIRESTTFPRAMAIGATRNPDYAYAVGKATAEEARAVGVHQNYAPVADVNNNPLNPVINTRAFGDDEELVSRMAAAFVKGTQDGGVIATVKHFPGHGDTDVDTHLRLSVLNFSKEHMDSVELPPFSKAFSAGALSVMVGHIAVPSLDTSANLPATVSPELSTNLLQDQMGFKGLIVTDAMDMRGVSTRYPPGESAVLALKAGIDLILLPPHTDIAIDAIVAAVQRGELTEARIDRSVRKLLKMKQWAGLDRNPYVDVDAVSDVVASPDHEALALEVARKSISIIGNKDGLLPLSHADTTNFLDLVFADREDASTGREFHRELRHRHANLSFYKIDPRSNRLDCDSALALANGADKIILQLHYFTRSGQMTGFLDQDQCDFINRLIAVGKPVVAVSFGNPYLVMKFPTVGTYVCSYDPAPATFQATAEVLFGEAPASGKLPITIPDVAKFGDGVSYPQGALRDGTLEEAGFDPVKFAAVDSVLDAAVADSAFPGAVLLVAHNDIVAYDKAYGFMTYDTYAQPVTPRTMYDLASVTKVIATTSSVMRLLGEGKISLDDPVVKYFPQFGQQGKEHITLYNLMVHNSGLPAWRKFYEFCSTPQCVMDSIFATPLVYHTGDSTLYSDLGLITMGKIIEKVSGTTLDRYVDSVFFKPLGMFSTMYNPPEELRSRIAPTEVDTFWRKTGQPVWGTVHDENASVLGGVSGHAGLFSTASDLSVLLQMLLNGGTYEGKRYLDADIIARFITRQSESSSRGIGWDTPNLHRSWAGSLISRKAFIHTGFTGTSVAVDPERKLIIVLLTNRVYPTRANTKIFRVRPAVHDAIIRALK